VDARLDLVQQGLPLTPVGLDRLLFV